MNYELYVRKEGRRRKMGAKGALLCLFAVVVLHCCAAKEEREDSKMQWKSIEEIVSEMPRKI